MTSHEHEPLPSEYNVTTEGQLAWRIARPWPPVQRTTPIVDERATLKSQSMLDVERELVGGQLTIPSFKNVRVEAILEQAEKLKRNS